LRAAMAAPCRPLISGACAGSAFMHDSRPTWRGSVTAPPQSGQVTDNSRSNHGARVRNTRSKHVSEAASPVGQVRRNLTVILVSTDAHSRTRW
jgi:hypothetical protein